MRPEYNTCTCMHMVSDGAYLGNEMNVVVGVLHSPVLSLIAE